MNFEDMQAMVAEREANRESDAAYEEAAANGGPDLCRACKVSPPVYQLKAFTSIRRLSLVMSVAGSNPPYLQQVPDEDDPQDLEDFDIDWKLKMCYGCVHTLLLDDASVEFFSPYTAPSPLANSLDDLPVVLEHEEECYTCSAPASVFMDDMGGLQFYSIETGKVCMHISNYHDGADHKYLCWKCVPDAVNVYNGEFASIFATEALAKWSTKNHALFPQSFHTMVMCTLLAMERFLPALPKDIWEEFIFPFASASSSTPKMRTLGEEEEEEETREEEGASDLGEEEDASVEDDASVEEDA